MLSIRTSLSLLSLLVLLHVPYRVSASIYDGPDLAAKLAAIEKAVDSRREALHIPGASLVIIKDDKVIYVKGLGLRDVEQKLPVTPNTLFAIGSSSKAFTAMTVMMSADEGKLSLTDSPKKYLPYFKLRDPEADGKITVGDLLCHRSGLARTDMAWGTGRLKPAEVIRVAGLAKPGAKYGAAFQYQNVMFLAAGEVVSKVQRMPWRRFLKQRIFDPLDMHSTNSHIDDMTASEDFALGYALNAETQEFVHLPMRNLECIAPAGAINSNAVDMAKWVRLMLNDGVFNGKRLVSENGFKELTANHMLMGGTNDYGYGWMLHNWNGHRVVEHGGNIDGFNAQVALMPDQRLGFALLTNVSASSLGAFTMDRVWETFVGAPEKPARKTTLVSAPSGPALDPDKEVGTYKFPAANVVLTVTMADGKLRFSVPGQPAYPLEPLGGRRYKLGSPAPEGFFATFRNAAGDPGTPEVFVEQPQGNAVFVKGVSLPTKIAITVEELMQKVIEAAGGETNLRKHKSLHQTYSLTIDTQGVSGRGFIYMEAPGKRSDVAELIGAGKNIGMLRWYCDGVNAGVEATFNKSSRQKGKDLVDAIAAANFSPELNWKKLYKTVTIKGLAKVGEEEVFEVQKTPDKGNPVTDYYSTKSFLLLKRDNPGGVSETFREYKAVDGVQISFSRSETNPIGQQEIKVTGVRFGERFSKETFEPHEVPSEIPMRAWQRTSWL